MGSDQGKSGWLRPIVLGILGAIGGALLGYLSSVDQKRLDLLRTSRRDAYVQFLNAQVLWNLNLEPAKYETETAEARKKIAIYGDQEVATALAKYWREHFSDGIAVCGESPEKNRDDVAIYQSMRQDIMPIRESISDADMMLLINFCRLPG